MFFTSIHSETKSETTNTRRQKKYQIPASMQTNPQLTEAVQESKHEDIWPVKDTKRFFKLISVTRPETY